MDKHTWGNPCSRDDDSHNSGCMWCDGGLEVCSECGAFEGATPDECPAEPIAPGLADQIYAGKWNYRNGQWRTECCKAMRHIHDTENYMAEAGYVPDGVNAAGNRKWVKRETSG